MIVTRQVRFIYYKIFIITGFSGDVLSIDTKYIFCGAYYVIHKNDMYTKA